MSLGFDSDQSDPSPLAEINTTPLIDVMLVLLIMLIVTIPALPNAIHLDIPEGGRQPETPPPTITIAAEGEIAVNGTVVADRQELGRSLVQSAVREAHVRVSPDAAYGRVALVLAECQARGVAVGIGSAR